MTVIFKEYLAFITERIIQDSGAAESTLKKYQAKYKDNDHFDENYLAFIATTIEMITGAEDIDISKAYLKDIEPNKFSCSGYIDYGS
jgi:hypothetical protein